MTNTPSTILVIDDEVHITHVVSLKLRNAGHTVITASDGEEGFDAALTHKPSLIITDLQMPYLSGLELSKKLLEHRVTADIPVLILTARGYGLDPDDLVASNIVGMLSKPFSPREILEKVNAVLQDALAKDGPDRSAA